MLWARLRATRATRINGYRPPNRPPTRSPRASTSDDVSSFSPVMVTRRNGRRAPRASQGRRFSYGTTQRTISAFGFDLGHLLPTHGREDSGGHLSASGGCARSARERNERRADRPPAAAAGVGSAMHSPQCANSVTRHGRCRDMLQRPNAGDSIVGREHSTTLQTRTQSGLPYMLDLTIVQCIG